MQHRDEWWVQKQWSSKKLQEEVGRQQERLRERKERAMVWSGLFQKLIQSRSHSLLTSVFTVYMSTWAARQLWRSVIIIYLFRMQRVEGYSACKAVSWALMLGYAEQRGDILHWIWLWRKLSSQIPRTAYGDVMLHMHNAIHHMLGK